MHYSQGTHCSNDEVASDKVGQLHRVPERDDDVGILLGTAAGPVLGAFHLEKDRDDKRGGGGRERERKGRGREKEGRWERKEEECNRHKSHN